MITYGHEKFIQEAMEGVFIQKTDFPVELIIANDCSPDETDKKVQEFAKNIPSNITLEYIRHAENKGMSANFIWAMQQAKGEYIAFCDGDDFWTDPLKLQQQISFLDAHRGYSFCCHRYTILSQSGYGSAGDRKNLLQNTDREFAHYHYKEGDLEIDHPLFYNTWVTMPVTAVFRADSVQEIIASAQKLTYFRDIHLFYLLLKQGKGISLNRFMAVYRLHDNGIESGADKAKDLQIKVALWKELWHQFRSDRQLREQYIEAGLRAVSALPKRKRLRPSFKLLKAANSPELLFKIGYYLFI